MKPFALVTLALALLGAGCATVPLAPATPDRLVTSAPSPETAAIVVARPGIIGTAVLVEVILDGVVVGNLAVKTYLHLDVTPGVHTLTVNWGAHVERVQIALTPGQQAFYRVTSLPATITALDAQDGAKAVKRSRLALRLDQ